MTIFYYWDKKLKKYLHVLEADIITIKIIWFDVSSSKDGFLQDVFQMTAIARVSVINHYHINFETPYSLIRKSILPHRYSEQTILNWWHSLVWLPSFL